jgi:hypothetical protein
MIHALCCLAMSVFQPVVVTGYIRTATGAPIESAAIEVRSGEQTRAVVLSDSTGAFSAQWDVPVYPFDVIVRRPGFRPVTRAVTLRDVEHGTVTLEFVLVEVPYTLAATTVTARAERPSRDINADRVGPGGRVQELDTQSGLGGRRDGDLVAAMQRVPGVNAASDASGRVTVSAFGLTDADNGQTLNGTTFRRAPLPRDGIFQTVRLSAYDPRAGRFSGLQLNSTVLSGNILQRRTLRATLEPSLPNTRAPGARLFGSPPQSVVVSGEMSGPLRNEQWFYNSSAQFQRTTTRVALLDGASRNGLVALGASPGALDLLASSANAVGLPYSKGESTGTRSSHAVSAVGRFDFTPNDQPTGDSQNDVVYLLGAFSSSASAGLGLSPFATKSVAAVSRDDDAALLLNWAPFLKTALLEMKSRIALSQSTGSPRFASLPSALVTVAQDADARGPGAWIPLRLGGSASGGRRDRSASWENSADLSWKTLNGAHRFNAYAQIELQSRRVSASAPSPGGFTYLSVSDFARNRPSSYQRTLTGAGIGASAIGVALAFSDVHAVTPNARREFVLDPQGLVLQYGLRLEGDYVTGTGAPDAAFTRAFGINAGANLNRVALLPMAGFTWRGGEIRTVSGGLISTSTRHQIDGGFRFYRGSLSPLGHSALPLDALRSARVSRIECVGDAVPAPDWRAYAAGGGVANTCAGTVENPLASQSSDVFAISKRFDAPRSFRAEVSWTWTLQPRIWGTVATSFASNTRQTETLDLNFDPQRQFGLMNEGGRPVFVVVQGIDPASGTPSLTTSRRTSEFARAIEFRATAASQVRQATATLNWQTAGRSLAPPDHVQLVNGGVRAAYTVSVGSRAGMGFSIPTDGDPTSAGNGRIELPKHVVLLEAHAELRDWFEVRGALRIASGVPFTPMVAGDINGDGYSNDRAFVFATGGDSDALVRSGMERLLATAPQNVARCLRTQTQRIAAFNSCDGRWTSSLGTLSVAIAPRRLGLGDRGTVTIYVDNLLSSLDYWFHGENALRGWGQFNAVDPVLLRATGFDAARQRYRYEVNPGFGGNVRQRSVFQPALALSFDLAVGLHDGFESQMVRRQLVSVRSLDTKASVKALKRRFLSEIGARAGEDVDLILRSQDSLDLAPARRDELLTLQRARRQMRDTLYGELAEFLVHHSSANELEQAREKWHSILLRSLTSADTVSRSARALLSPDQIAWLRSRGLLPFLNHDAEWLTRMARRPLTDPF